MNVVKEIRRLNEREANLSTSSSGSWHEQYKDSAHIFVGGLPFNLTEGDIICILSQFGEIAGINLVRDKESGKSRGFAFIKYVDQRSTVLAVDNMNGSKVAGRVIRVDHVQNYKVPKVFDADGNEVEPDEDMVNNAAPKPIEEENSGDESSSESEADDTGIDINDPMREYLLQKRYKKDNKSKKSSKRKSGKDGDDGESKAERRARRELKKAAKKEKKENKERKKGDVKVDDIKENGDEVRHERKEKESKSQDEGSNKMEEEDQILKSKGSRDGNERRQNDRAATVSSSGPPPGAAAAPTGGRRSRSRSLSPVSRRPRSYRDRSRSLSPSPNRYSSSTYPDRSRDRARDGGSSSSKRDSRQKDTSRSRDRDRYRDDSKDRYSSRRRRSPSPYSRRRENDRDARYRSRSRSPRGRRSSPDYLRSRSRSPRRP